MQVSLAYFSNKDFQHCDVYVSLATGGEDADIGTECLAVEDNEPVS